MILSREDVHKYRDVIEALRGISPEMLNRIYGHLHADTCQKLWADRYNLKESRGTPCLRRLLGKQQPGVLSWRPPGCDHASLWLLRGKPIVYVTQPYHFDLQKLADFCREHDFVGHVDLWPAWHYPHRVFHIEITTKEGRKLLDIEGNMLRRHARSTVESLEGKST